MGGWVSQLGLTWMLDPLPPATSSADMEEMEPKVTIEAIAVLLGGRESSSDVAGNTLALAPFEIELGPEMLDSNLPSSTNRPVKLGLGLFWECLEQAPTSKIKGLGNSGPEPLLILFNQGVWALESPLSNPLIPT